MIDTKKILIVEDDTLIRNLYKRSLEKNGYTVIEATDGEEGYLKIKEGGYELVLLDVMLPKLNGIDILKRLHDIDLGMKYSKKIVMLSNLDDDVVKEDSKAFGVDGYLIKSHVDITKLLDELKPYLS